MLIAGQRRLGRPDGLPGGRRAAGTYIGLHLGWCTAFLAVAVIGALALAGDLLVLPSVPGSPACRCAARSPAWPTSSLAWH
jgi:predicted MFS family arabinose efflux permease